MPVTLEEAVAHTVREKRVTARVHLGFAIAFATTFIGFCAGGVFFAEKMGAVAFGIACTVSAMLVLALLSSSRSLNSEAARLRVLGTYNGADAHDRILQELSAAQADGATTALQTLRDAVLNKKTG